MCLPCCIVSKSLRSWFVGSLSFFFIWRNWKLLFTKKLHKGGATIQILFLKKITSNLNCRKLVKFTRMSEVFTFLRSNQDAIEYRFFSLAVRITRRLQFHNTCDRIVLQIFRFVCFCFIRSLSNLCEPETKFQR